MVRRNTKGLGATDIIGTLAQLYRCSEKQAEDSVHGMRNVGDPSAERPLQGGTIHIVAVDPRGGTVYDDIWGTVHVAISIPGGTDSYAHAQIASV